MKGNPTYMYKRILIGVDGSDISDYALKNALELAKKLKASVDILYVLPRRIEPIFTERSAMTEFGGDEHFPLPVIKGSDE